MLPIYYDIFFKFLIQNYIIIKEKLKILVKKLLIKTLLNKNNP